MVKHKLWEKKNNHLIKLVTTLLGIDYEKNCYTSCSPIMRIWNCIWFIIWILVWKKSQVENSEDETLKNDHFVPQNFNSSNIPHVSPTLGMLDELLMANFPLWLLTSHWFYSVFHTLITSHIFFPKHMSDLSVERWILAASTDLLSNRNS